MNTENSKDLSLKIEQALALQQDNQVDAAIAIFKEILLAFPQQPDALHGLGMAYAQQQNFTLAVKFLSQAVQSVPHIAEFHNNLGNAYKALGKIESARTHYQEALRLKPIYPQAHNNLGALLYRLAQHNEAILHFEKALRMDPNNVESHYNLANSFMQVDRLIDAIAHYQEVLKLRPDHLGALHNLGITFCAIKHYEEAKPLLLQVIEREPKNLEALFHLGIIHSSLAEAEKAKEFYERVLAISPDHSNSHHNLATIYLHLNQKEKALEHYKTALSLQPENKTAQHMIDALMGKTTQEGAPLEYTRALFDQYAYNYDQHVTQKLHYQVPYLLRQAISPHLLSHSDPWLVLDIGCGSGLCAPVFADVAGKLIGVDISPNMISVARARGGYYKLVEMDIMTYLEMHSKEYDLIISADVFVYFGALDKLFTACHRALKSGGLFCFSVETLNDSEISLSHPDFYLRKTARYAHHPDYVRKISEATHFQILSQQEHILRYQEEIPIFGNIYVLKK